MYGRTARARTQHTSCLHRARCNSEELLRIQMSEFPPLLLRKQATIGSLSQNLFCQLQAKGKWLTILESQKKERGALRSLNKQTKVLLLAQTNKQGCSYEFRRIYIYLWCPSGALASNFSRWYLSSISISTCFGEALASGWPWSLSLSLYLFYHACKFNSHRICARNLYNVLARSTPKGYVHKFCVLTFWLVWGFMPACSIPIGYMHEFYV